MDGLPSPSSSLYGRQDTLVAPASKTSVSATVTYAGSSKYALYRRSQKESSSYLLKILRKPLNILTDCWKTPRSMLSKPDWFIIMISVRVSRRPASLSSFYNLHLSWISWVAVLMSSLSHSSAQQCFHYSYRYAQLLVPGQRPPSIYYFSHEVFLQSSDIIRQLSTPIVKLTFYAHECLIESWSVVHQFLQHVDIPSNKKLFRFNFGFSYFHEHTTVRLAALSSWFWLAYCCSRGSGEFFSRASRPLQLSFNVLFNLVLTDHACSAESLAIRPISTRTFYGQARQLWKCYPSCTASVIVMQDF